MRKFCKEILSRLQFAKELYVWGWRWVVFVVWGLPYGLGSLYSFLRSEEFTSWAALHNIIPERFIRIWAWIGLILFIIITFEGAYRIVQKERNKLLAKMKPIPISNRDELIRAMTEVKLASGELLMAQEHLDDLQVRDPGVTSADVMNSRDNAANRFQQAMDRLEAEKMVAGKPFENIFSDLIGYISTQVWVKTAKPIFVGGDPQQFRIRTALEIFGRIAGRVDEVIHKIEELSGQGPDKEGSQS